MNRPRGSTDCSEQLLLRTQRGDPDAFAELHAATGPTDADLLSRVTAGDRQAFETLYIRHWQNLLGFVHQQRRSLDDHAAGDVASEVLSRVWQNRIRLGSVANLSAYWRCLSCGGCPSATPDNGVQQASLGGTHCIAATSTKLVRGKPAPTPSWWAVMMEQSPVDGKEDWLG